MVRSVIANLLTFMTARHSLLFFLITLLTLLTNPSHAADLTLAWDPSPTSDVSIYRVYYGTQSQTYTTQACEVTNLSCTVTGLTEGQTYYFAATAINSQGEGNYSGEISYTVPAAPPPTYTINASAGSNGSISPSGSVNVTAGASQAFAITPNSGYIIADVRVNNSSVGAVSSYTFSNVRSNQTISATFIAQTPTTYIISASAGSNGRISPSGSVDVTAGASQAFAITPNSGYIIADVRVNNSSVGAVSSYTFSNVRSNQSISASFMAAPPLSYTISASAGSNGRISPSGSVDVTAGASQGFNITPNNGYVIADVRVNNSSVGAVSSYTFSNIRSNQSITATFIAETPTTHTISVMAGSNGSISPSGSVSVTDGTSQSFSIMPNSGYVIADVRVNNSSVGPVSSYTFSNVRSNQSISASFEVPPDNQAPDHPNLLFPGNGETRVELTPLLEITGFSDPDANDGHAATRWQIATDIDFKNLVLDITSDANSTHHYLVSFQVPQGSLFSQRPYYWRVMVKDDRASNALWSAWSQIFQFTTADPVIADSNGNGVPDEIEPETSDLDADGQNDNDQPLMRVYATETEGHQIGIKTVDGVDQINWFAPVDPTNLPDADSLPQELPYGLMNLNLKLIEIGGKAKIEIYLPEPPDSKYRWLKFDPVNGWYEYPVFIEPNKYILEIVDGGFGDADGIANGFIVDPIGMSIDKTATSSAGGPVSLATSGTGGSGCFVASAGRGGLRVNPGGFHLIWMSLSLVAVMKRKR